MYAARTAAQLGDTAKLRRLARDPDDNVREALYDQPKPMPDGSLYSIIRYQGCFAAKFTLELAYLFIIIALGRVVATSWLSDDVQAEKAISRTEKSSPNAPSRAASPAIA